jgi:hypothetical protein
LTSSLGAAEKAWGSLLAARHRALTCVKAQAKAGRSIALETRQQQKGKRTLRQ